jgi:hypothetical protein
MEGYNVPKDGDKGHSLSNSSTLSSFDCILAKIERVNRKTLHFFIVRMLAFGSGQLLSIGDDALHHHKLFKISFIIVSSRLSSSISTSSYSTSSSTYSTSYSSSRVLVELATT